MVGFLPMNRNSVNNLKVRKELGVGGEGRGGKQADGMAGAGLRGRFIEAVRYGVQRCCV